MTTDWREQGWGRTREDNFWYRVERTAQPRYLLTGCITFYAVYFVRLVSLRHTNFGTFDYDLGIWDQYIWLMANGESFNTIRGLHNLGFHASYGLVVFVPFYWLGAGPGFLNAAMVLSIAAGAIPVFRIARHLLRDEWLSLALAVSYLANFSLQWQIQETFHPETLAVGPLLFAYNAGLTGKWRSFVGWAFFAVMLKEDLALAVAMMGLVLSTLSPASAGANARRNGALTFAISIGWFLFATKWLLPHFAGEAFYAEFYDHLGDGLVGYADTAATNPTEYWRAFDRSSGPHYVRDLHVSYGFVSLLSPQHLLVGLPQMAANLLSSVSNSWSPRVHYSAAPVVGSTIAMLHGVARPTRESVRKLLAILVLVSATVSGTSWGINGLSPAYSQAFWPQNEAPEYPDRQAAVALVPSGASVAASYTLAPHLTHRSNIYTFPNPWTPSNWGIANRDPHDPEVVDYIVIDLLVTTEPDRALLSSIIDNNPVWKISLFGESLVVAERIKEP